jgi:molybdate transport system substrate-binding protein
MVSSACGGPDSTDRLLVLAASDLQGVLPEMVAEFEHTGGPAVDLVLGSSGNLAAQIENGAPADLFFSANQAFVDRLEDGGLLVPGTRRDYAIGRLALVAPPGVPPPARPGDLRSDRYGIIALANPEHAPYGAAAREALQAQGHWDAIASRAVLAENVAQAAQFVRTGNADAGIVAIGVVLGYQGWRHELVPGDLHSPLVQTAAVVRGSAREEEARAFLALVTSARGAEMLARYGFEPPPEAP